MPTFNASFDPYRGDVIYGTTESRADYLERFLRSRELKQLQRRHPTQPFSYRTRGIYINDYNTQIAGADFSSPGNIRYAEPNWWRQEDYVDALEHSRYAPSSVTSSTWRDYAKGDARLRPNSFRTREQWAELAKNLAVRRACKFGIEYVTSMVGDAKVHYVLDRINLGEVVDKRPRLLTTTTSSAGIPITTSELRYLFRTWHRFRGRDRVIFYHHGQSTQAPWERRPDLWVPYARQRVHKYRNRGANPKQVEHFEKACNEGRHKAALDCFHDMRLNSPE